MTIQCSSGELVPQLSSDNKAATFVQSMLWLRPWLVAANGKQAGGESNLLRNWTSSPAEISLAKPVPPLHDITVSKQKQLW